MINKELIKPEDFTDKVNNVDGDNISFTKFQNLIIINYQGKNVAHSQNETLFTLPAGYRPNTFKIVGFVYQNSGAYGSAIISPNGVCTVGSVTDTTQVGRIIINGIIDI